MSEKMCRSNDEWQALYDALKAENERQEQVLLAIAESWEAIRHLNEDLREQNAKLREELEKLKNILLDEHLEVTNKNKKDKE